MECIALVTHYVYKEVYGEGTQGLGNYWNGETLKDETLSGLIKKMKEKLMVNALYIEEEKNSNVLVSSFFEDSDGIRATKEDIKKWKKGKRELFEHFIYFKIYISVTPEELEQFSDYI